MTLKFIRDHFGSPSLLIFVAVLLIYPAVGQSIQISLWHLWNGDVIRIGNYDIPVPADWVADTHDSKIISLVDIERTYWRGRYHPTIVIFQGIPIPNDPWAQEHKHKFHEEYLKSINAQVFDRRTIDIDGEPTECETTNDLVSQLPGPRDAILTIRCESESALLFTSYGDTQDFDSFFSFLSQIRKHGD